MDLLRQIIQNVIDFLKENNKSNNIDTNKKINALIELLKIITPSTAPAKPGEPDFPLPPQKLQDEIARLSRALLTSGVASRECKDIINTFGNSDKKGFEEDLIPYIGEIVKYSVGAGSLKSAFNFANFTFKGLTLKMLKWGLKKYFNLSTDVEGNTYTELLKNLLLQFVVEPIEHCKQETQVADLEYHIDKIEIITSTDQNQATIKNDHDTINVAIREAQELLKLCQKDVVKNTTPELTEKLIKAVDRICELVPQKIDKEKQKLDDIKKDLIRFQSYALALKNKSTSKSLSEQEIKDLISNIENLQTTLGLQLPNDFIANLQTYLPQKSSIGFFAKIRHPIHTIITTYSYYTTPAIATLFNQLEGTVNKKIMEIDNILTSNTGIRRELENLKQQSAQVRQFGAQKKILDEIGETLLRLTKKINEYNKLCLFFGWVFQTKSYKQHKQDQSDVNTATTQQANLFKRLTTTTALESTSTQTNDLNKISEDLTKLQDEVSKLSQLIQGKTDITEHQMHTETSYKKK